MAAFAFHVDVRAELAFFASRWNAIHGGTFSSVLAIAGAAAHNAAGGDRYSHNDYWNDFYVDGRTDHLDRIFCESVQLFGAIRSEIGLVAAFIEGDDAGTRIVGRRHFIFGGTGRLRIYHLAMGCERFRAASSSARNFVLVHVAFSWSAGDFFVAISEYAGD